MCGVRYCVRVAGFYHFQQRCHGALFRTRASERPQTKLARVGCPGLILKYGGLCPQELYRAPARARRRCDRERGSRYCVRVAGFYHFQQRCRRALSACEQASVLKLNLRELGVLVLFSSIGRRRAPIVVSFRA